MSPNGPSDGGLALPIGLATLPQCRAGLPARVFPGQDTLICDENSQIASKHLLVAVAAQNYGQNSYRIRQPFDIAGRTGTVVFDAEAYVQSGLLGWTSIEFQEDPTNAPSFAVFGNDEGGQLPRNGVSVQFQNTCNGWVDPQVPHVGVRMIEVFNEYVSTRYVPATPVCVPTRRGALNRFMLRLSQNRVEVYGTPYSVNGTSFGASVLMYSAAINLPFSRGYVSITTHNHATLKYSEGNAMDAWTARWDNVGFDGPVIANTREYEIPDSLVDSPTDSAHQPNPVRNVGYRIHDASDGPLHVLRFKNVDLSDARRARLSASVWYVACCSGPPANYRLRYRLNGRAWRERALNSGELAFLTSGNSRGALGQMLDVPLSDLVSGDNTLEFVTTNLTAYPSVVANIDLVLWKD
jgi:hypothetical protein